jgi:ArsR family transcriptional regulator, arsenate/arsenite/antimonite-responsive transcriptional repressor
MNFDMVSPMPAAKTIAPKTIAAKKPTADPIACCTPVRTDALHEDQATILAHSFAALADPIRLRLLSFITSSKHEVCACDLVEPSGRSQPTVSHHMKILVDAGLVSREKRGLWVWYRAVPQRLDALRSVLG